MKTGITAPESGFGPEPNLTIQNSYLRTNVNVAVPTVGSVNGCWMDNKLVVISNARFDAPPGRSLSSISMVRDVANSPECLSKLDEARIYAYNGNADDNFQIYHNDPTVLPRPPSGCTPITRVGITGLTCPIPSIFTASQRGGSRAFDARAGGNEWRELGPRVCGYVFRSRAGCDLGGNFGDRVVGRRARVLVQRSRHATLRAAESSRHQRAVGIRCAGAGSWVLCQW